MLLQNQKTMNHSITINDIATLKTFVPVEGTWTSSRGHDQIPQDIADDILEQTGLNVTVQLFRENGRTLQGEERSGSMLVTMA